MDINAVAGSILSSKGLTVFTFATTFITVSILWTVFKQIFFKNPNEPPVVFHWVPIIGSTVTYGIDPYKFYFACQAKYGDVFTFILLGRKVTVYLGPKGNQFILNGKLKDLNAEDIYSVLTTPVFGKDVIYDVPNAKFMEQKKFIKYGFSTGALRTYVPLMQAEIDDFLRKTPAFPSNKGTLNVPPIMAQITLFTAARSLQGQEVREKLDTTFAKLYHDLDDGFQPINFMLPWMPLPQNRRRDIAQRKMTQIYTDIINTRRASKMGKDSEDMIWNLMNATYKDGTPLPDHEIAHMMIALLMGGQHNTSVTSSWIMLRLASKPHLIDELYNEQVDALGSDLSKPLAYDDLEKLPLMTYTIRETLRLHTPIHSIMRKVKNPMPIENTRWVVPPQNILLATPAAMGRIDDYFPNPMEWDPHRWDTMSNPEDQEKEKTDYGYGLVATGADSTYLPFGAGRHRCIGEKYAYLQLTIIIAVMIRKFRWRNVEGKEAVVGTDYSSMFSRPLEPALIQWERRQEAEAKA
ncbi:Lanosterol 14-alpha-demethylase [Xanthoria calcicola]